VPSRSINLLFTLHLHYISGGLILHYHFPLSKNISFLYQRRLLISVEPNWGAYWERENFSPLLCLYLTWLSTDILRHATGHLDYTLVVICGTRTRSGERSEGKFFAPLCLFSLRGTASGLHGYASGRSAEPNIKREQRDCCPLFLWYHFISYHLLQYPSMKLYWETICALLLLYCTVYDSILFNVAFSRCGVGVTFAVVCTCLSWADKERVMHAECV